MTIGIGAIGLGGLAHVELDHLASMPNVKIVGGADIAPEARSVFEDTFNVHAYEDYTHLLANHCHELDAAIVVTPHRLHCEQAIACLNRDIHVFVEKPMATSVVDAERMTTAADERGLVLAVGYQRRFHPAFRELRRIVRDGRLGAIHMVSGMLGQSWIDNHRGTWRVDPGLSGGGQLYDSGSHLLDALLWITGAIPVAVGGRMTFHAPRIDVNSAITAELDVNGQPALSTIAISGDGSGPTPFERYVIWGTEGRATLEDGRLHVLPSGGDLHRIDVEDEISFQVLTGRKLENFVGAVRGTDDPAAPGEDGLLVTAFTEAIYEANETRCDVELDRAVVEGASHSP